MYWTITHCASLALCVCSPAVPHIVFLHSTHRIPPLPTGPLHRIPPSHPSTVPTVPLPIVPLCTLFLKFLHNQVCTCEPILHFCQPISHFCRPTFWVQWVGYSGTVQGVQRDRRCGTVVQCRGYSGTVQGYTGTARRVRWYGIGVQCTNTWAQVNWVYCGDYNSGCLKHPKHGFESDNNVRFEIHV